MRRAGKQPGQSLGWRRGPRRWNWQGRTASPSSARQTATGTQAKCPAHLNPAQNDLALNGQVPPTTPAARRRVGLSARGAPAQRIGLRSPLLALRVAQAKATATPTPSTPRGFALLRGGRPPLAAGGCLPPDPRAMGTEQKRPPKSRSLPWPGQ